MKTLKQTLESLVSGVGSILNSEASEKPDYLTFSEKEALEKDWNSVGQDIYFALESFEKQKQTPQLELNFTQK